MNIRVHVQGMVCLICGLALLGSLVHARKSEAATYYVATDGSDANPGTEGRPFQTLGRGVRELSPGDTLYVKNGTYTTWEMYDSPSGTSWANPVTIAAYPGHSPVIVTGLYLARNSYMVIDGFVIAGIEITWGYGSIADHIRIQNSEIAYAGHSGIFVTEGSDGNEFINLQVHNNGTTGFDHGIYIRSNNNIVDGCSIHDNAGWGVQVCSGSGANNNIIRNNTIYNNGGGGIIICAGSDNQAYDNIIWRNGIGIRVDYGASNTYVGRNILYENADYDIYIGPGSSNALVEFNSISGSSIVDNGVSTLILP